MNYESKPSFLKKFDFDSSLVSEFNNTHVKDLWPVVYILSDGNVNSYVGETNAMLG
jgi:hypothetical protein